MSVLTGAQSFVTKQASLDEDKNILETIKSLQKENLQLKDTLKEKDSTISRLMEITKDQVLQIPVYQYIWSLHNF